MPEAETPKAKDTSIPAAKPKKHHILIVDDHPILREGLAQLISAEPDLIVCGQAEDAHSALEMAEKLRPDLAVVDIGLKGRNGLELLKDLKIRMPGLPVLILSMYDEAVYARRALRAGAAGYVMKQEARERIVGAIHCVLKGKIYVSPAIEATLDQTDRPRELPRDLAVLSDRELEVLHLIGQGLGTRQVAERLVLSVKTIEAHREHIKAKLGLRSGTELMRFAVERALDLERGGATPDA